MTWLERWAQFKFLTEAISAGITAILFLAITVIVLWVIISDMPKKQKRQAPRGCPKIPRGPGVR